ncbi:hypothetical protein WG66_013200 [Moniliophthora roreri]|nr:hypothetical protein WG66_013200 [Moniliophthora roreri]
MFFLDHYEETLERKCFHDDCAETETSTYTVDIGVRNERYASQKRIYTNFVQEEWHRDALGFAMAKLMTQLLLRKEVFRREVTGNGNESRVPGMRQDTYS